MPHQFLLSAALALFGATGVLGQSAATTSNPLNNFIGAAASALSQINSNLAAESTHSSSSTSATPTPSSSSAANAAATSSPSTSPHTTASSEKHRDTIIIVVCVVVGVIVLGLILGALLCCLARRRRRRRTTTPIQDDEIEGWRSSQPNNPGRAYGRVSNTEQQPTVPAMAMVDQPNMAQHPANRPQNPFSQQSALRPENPFVPVPPNPRGAPNSGEGLTGGIVPAAAAGAIVAAPLSQRRAPNSREGITDGTVPGAPLFIAPRSEGQRLRSSNSPARGRSATYLNQGSLPSQNPSGHTATPFGLIGQPYDEMHVHVLQGEAPSEELRNSLNARDPVRGYNTPPRVPSRSPRRAAFADSTYSSTDGSTSVSGNGNGDDWQHSQMGPVNTGAVRWEQGPRRYSNSPRQSMQASPASMQAPPVPWTEGERKYSGSPRGSMGPAPWSETRRSSSSPRQSLPGTPRQSQSGTPRRLRFSDFPETDPMDNHRYSQGVGEAL